MTAQFRIAFWLICCLLMLMGFVSIAHAEAITLKGDNPTPVALAPHYQIYIDNQHKLNIDDILSPKNQIKFSPLTKQSYKAGFKQDAIWFKVDVNNTNAYEVKQLLEFNFPLLDDLGVYIVHKYSNRILARFDATNAQSFNSRLYQHSNFIFPVTLPAKTEMVFYFRLQSGNYVSAQATLWQPAAFAEQDRLAYFLVCLYLGLLIGLVCYTFILYLLVHDTHYLYYALFSSAMLLAVGSYRGVWFEVFWPNMSHWQAMSIPIGMAVSGLFATLFARSLLQTKSDAPALDKAFIFISIVFVLTLCLTPFISNIISMKIIALCIFSFIFIAVMTAIVLSIRGSRIGQFYLISWFAFFIGAALFSAQTLGWLPNSFWSQNSIIYGSTLEMLILFFILAKKMTLLDDENNDSRQEVFKAQNQLITTLRDNDQELFNLVKKRTTTLEKANEYLLSQHGKIHDTLTGLANAALVAEQLQLLLALCKRKKAKLVVLLLNLNDFKKVNTDFGHEVGDKLLITVAARIRDNLRESDTAARTKGDEFIILLDVNNPAKDPEQISRKIKKAIAQTAIIDGYAIQITVSIGIAIYPDNADEVDDLLSKATRAMYVNKGYVKSSVTKLKPQ